MKRIGGSGENTFKYQQRDDEFDFIVLDLLYILTEHN